VTGVFFIVGPTASGNSDVAAAVAALCGAEIVSADAFQIYEGLEILTAKPDRELRARVPHHLIGEIPLTHSFDVAQYLGRAACVIREIRARGKVPIVCGGSGLYLRALSRGLADLPAADAELRAGLETLPLAELAHRFAEHDPLGATQIDLQNRRRLIRALEVCMLTGKAFSSFRDEWNQPVPDARGVLLTRPRDTLHARIDRRTEAMFAGGVHREVADVREIGPTAEQTIGWREIQALLAGTMDRAECIAAIQQATKRYAKRQLTWLRRESGLEVVALTEETELPLLDRLARTAGGVR
jgi:tRNA dimethylallyltransferase